MRALGAVADAPGASTWRGATAVLEGWQDRSRSITQEGRLSFCHYDDYGAFRAAVVRAVR